MPLHLVSTGQFHGDPTFDVYSGRVKVGVIRRITKSEQVVWAWTIALCTYPPDFKNSGSTFEKEHAMSAFKRAWTAWLRALRAKR